MKNKEKAPKAKNHSLKKFLTSRKAKRGAVSVAITAVFICIIVLVNIITGVLVDKFPGLQLDMTASKTYELQKDTTQYLNQLDKDVNVYVLSSEKAFKAGLNAYQGSEYITQAHKLLKKMAAVKHLNVEYIDTAANPNFTNKYKDIDWTADNTSNLILIDCGEKYTTLALDECFTYDSEAYNYGYYVYTDTKIEQAVITGVLDVTTAEKVTVDFITGSGVTESGYSPLKKLLKSNAYEVEDINLTTNKLNADSKIAVLYAPTVDLSEDAAAKLEKWLDNDGENGKTLIYIPIDVQTETPNIDALLKKYGMKVSDGLCFCTNPNYFLNSFYMFLTDYNNDEYTETLKNARVNPITYYTRDVEVTDASAASPLLTTTASAGMIPFKVDTSKIKDEKEIEKYYKADGINTAAIGKKTNSDGESSNIAVFGSPYMFSEDFLGTNSFNNANYIVNLCNTVTDRGDMGITITSAQVDSGELGVTNDATTLGVGIVFIFAIPVIILIIGLVIYIRRRTK